MITKHKLGGRTVELFIPIESVKQAGMVDKIVLAPILWDHTLKWKQGRYTIFNLLIELSGVDEDTLKRLRYPDAERVQQTFMEMLPNEIRDDIINGRLPQPAPPQDQPQDQQPFTPPPEPPLPPISNEPLGTGGTGFDLEK